MRRTTIIVASLLVFLALSFIVLRTSPKSAARLQGGLLEMISPFFKTGSSVRNNINAFTEGLKTLEMLEKENAKLKVEIKELRVVNQVLRNNEAEINQLRSALNFKSQAVFALVPAQVIGRESSTWWSTLLIDRGSDDGILPDMAVLTDAGLVGKTAGVGRNTSRVILLVDERCQVASVVDGRQDSGIAGGTRSSTTTDPELVLRFLPKSSTLQPGMRVVSSGVGGVFPAGLLVGTVEQFAVKELNAEARLKPAVDFASIEEVFIVVDRK